MMYLQLHHQVRGIGRANPLGAFLCAPHCRLFSQPKQKVRPDDAMAEAKAKGRGRGRPPKAKAKAAESRLKLETAGMLVELGRFW